MPLPKLYDIVLEGSLLLSEFQCPRTNLVKQQQHIFFYKKNWKQKITLDMVPSTLDMEPSTLHKNTAGNVLHFFELVLRN